MVVGGTGGRSMSQNLDDKRALYLAKIKQTEKKLAAKSIDSNAIQDLNLIADGYRVLLDRLRDEDPSTH